MVTITSVTPTYGVSTSNVTLDIAGSGYTALTAVRIISPTSPPVTYTLTGVVYFNGTDLHATIPASLLPLGIYDVQVDNGGGDDATLSQCYRSSVQLIDPYTDQTLAVLQTRVRSRIGLAQNGRAYDLRIGSTISDILDAPLPEIEIFYNRLGRILKQGFAQYTGGVYLRLRAEEHGVIAKPASPATGVVKISAPIGTILPVGMTFSNTITANSGNPAITFTSTETAQKVQKAPVTGSVTSATVTSLVDTTKAWTVNEWTGHYVWITSGTGVGQVFKILTNTATSVVIQGWNQGATPDVTSHYQLFAGVDVQADTPGTIGNVAAGAINILTSPTSFVTAIVNPITLSSGLNAETDAQLLARYLLTVRSPSSGGNVTDYERWAQATPGVGIGQVFVIPLWSGNGTVKVVILNSDGTIPSSSVVAQVQQYLDPGSLGQGGGIAPIGAKVTVQAATAIPIDVAVTVTVTPGYNAALVKTQVQQAIIDYVNNLPVGQDVLFTQVQHTILHDTSQANYDRLGVTDYDILTTGRGIKKSSSGTWTQANITMAGTEKPTVGTVTVY